MLTNRKTVSDVKEFWSCDNKVADTEDGAVKADPGAAQETVAEQPEQETKWSKEEILKQSRKFNIDLTPRLLYSRGDMVELLISSNISRYTEFKSVTRVLTRLGGRLEQVPSSRSDVFNTKQISVVEKRILMKFLTQCMQETEENAVDPGKSFGDYLKQQKLTPNLMHYVSHSIAMVPPTETATKGLAATRKFLSSLGRFGPTPFLWSMYGTGELPQVLPIYFNKQFLQSLILLQAFCRLCAVFGGIYYLGKTVNKIVVKNNKVTAVVIENKKIRCDHLVVPAHQLPDTWRGGEEGRGTSSSRAVFLSAASLLPSDKEQLTFLSLPQDTSSAIHLVEVGAGAAATPRGLHLLHASAAGHLDLETTMRVLGVVSEEQLVYSLSWRHADPGLNGEARPGSCVWSAAGPAPELDFDLAIANARAIYSGMFPEEEFLPRAPDPEEIVFGEEEAQEQGKDQDTEGEEVEEESGNEENAKNIAEGDVIETEKNQDGTE